jgi:hypothetical protein
MLSAQRAKLLRRIDVRLLGETAGEETAGRILPGFVSLYTFGLMSEP